MKTFLVNPNEAAADFGQRKPVPQRIGDTNGGFRRAWFTIWSALATALVATPSYAQFLYVTNYGGPTVSGYKMERCTGALTPIDGSPFRTGNHPFSVAVNPSGRFAYVANNFDNTVWGYAINPRTGKLTRIAAPVASGARPVFVTVDPSGRFVYAVCGEPFRGRGSDVSGYTINQTTGKLTAIAGSPFVIPEIPTRTENLIEIGTSVAVDPSDTFAYVTTIVQDHSGFPVASGIVGFSIDPGTGALSLAFPPISLEAPFGIPTTPSSVAVDPSGKFAYFGDWDGSPVHPARFLGFAINPTSGDLDRISNSSTGLGPSSVAMDPSGKFVYVTNSSSNNVTGYRINLATGGLTPVAGSPFPTGLFPIGMAVDPSGMFAYVANLSSSSISGYTIDPSTGALTAMAGSPFGVNGQPYSVAIARP